MTKYNYWTRVEPGACCRFSRLWLQTSPGFGNQTLGKLCGLWLRKQVILESHKRTVKARGDQEGDGLDAAWQQHGMASYKCSVGSQMTFNCWKWWGKRGKGFTTVTCDFPVCLWVGGRSGNTTRSMPVLLADGAFEASPLTPEQLANMAKEARAKAKSLAEPVLVYDLWSVWGSLQCLVCYDVCFAM